MSARLPAALRLVVVVPLLAAAGCAAPPGDLGHMATESDFAAIQPGWTTQQVLARFGRPTWTFGVRQENLTIWNYRFNRNDCIIYQVSMRPDGTVRDANSGYDPACDGPDGRD